MPEPIYNYCWRQFVIGALKSTDSNQANGQNDLNPLADLSV